jgi:uncharacterized protein with FMN-binding domain
MRTRPRAVIAVLALLASTLALSCRSPAKIPVGRPDPQGVPDGTYEGAYRVFPVKVRLRVTIAAGRIENIELLEHFNGKGTAAEALIPRVIERQSLDVDIVSGATYSSKAILKAIENALSR